MDGGGSHEREAIPEAGSEAQTAGRSLSYVLRDRFWSLCYRGFLVLFAGMAFLLLSTIHTSATIMWVLRGVAFGAGGLVRSVRDGVSGVHRIRAPTDERIRATRSPGRQNDLPFAASTELPPRTSSA